MIYKISYAQALERHPVEVGKLVTKIRKGKSPRREADPKTWDWLYRVAVKIHTPSSLDPSPFKQVVFCVLGTELGRAWANVDLEPVPQFIQDMYPTKA